MIFGSPTRSRDNFHECKVALSMVNLSRLNRVLLTSLKCKLLVAHKKFQIATQDFVSFDGLFVIMRSRDFNCSYSRIVVGMIDSGIDFTNNFGRITFWHCNNIASWICGTKILHYFVCGHGFTIADSALFISSESDLEPNNRYKIKRRWQASRLLICKSIMVRERGLEPPRPCEH